MSRKLSLALIVAWAIVFTASGIWSYFSADPFALPGLRKVAAADPLSRWLQVSAVLFCAVWLAIGSWHTRDRLLVFQGMAAALFLQGFLYIGVPFGLAFGCFAGIARQRANQIQ